MKTIMKIVLFLVVITISIMIFIYPVVIISSVLFDKDLQETGECRFLIHWFKSTAKRYVSWAEEYIKTNHAESLYHDDVAATEWPMFGSVFFLVTAEDLHKRGEINANNGYVRKAINRAAQIIVSPVTATWVKTKWGNLYLEQQNVFYRMMLILGLSSYENITGVKKYHTMMSQQRRSLTEELTKAKLHLSDDYPGECYPSDILWAVAAAQRAAKLEDTNHNSLAKSLMKIFDGPVKAPEGLPAFQIDSETGEILQGSRGCGNSGILIFSSELDSEISKKWYSAYETNFWKDIAWAMGFSEVPKGSSSLMDVDSGPIVYGIGFVASALGIGASKTVGRLDHTVPLTMEAIACAWPTPFGFLVPSLMGKLAAGSWVLGDIALLFSMTRPIYEEELVFFQSKVPLIVWLFLLAYFLLGVFFIGMEVRCLIDLRKNFSQIN